MSPAPPAQPAVATPTNDREYRPARSKHGCNTCRRRKVRCNEQRPRCSHCERLNLECTWHRVLLDGSGSNGTLVPATTWAIRPQDFDAAIPTSFPVVGSSEQRSIFNSTWDEAMLLSPSAWPSYRLPLTFEQQPPMPQPVGGVWSTPALPNAGTGVAISSSPRTGGTATGSANAAGATGTTGTTGTTAAASAGATAAGATGGGSSEAQATVHIPSPDGSAASVDNEYLLESFLQIFIPPILVPVEIGPKLATTKSLFASMSAKSSMVRLAIMAFSAFQLSRSQSQTGGLDYKPFYDRASQEVRKALASGTSAGIPRGELEYFLAAIFLLTYADLLTEKLPQAHANLKEAFNWIHKSGNGPFTTTERRLISWIRLLDARAVSTAGGEGLFLTDDDAMLASSPEPTGHAVAPPASIDAEIEELLFDVLYQPGLVFYQKVQSFVGRITNIDPWHRSRGTVRDETEVMAIAADISRDLHALYDQRPALMDHAVAGNLTEKHLAKSLVAAITRSFRTYLANYHASLIHLHRVAYKQFPSTADVQDAVMNIKWLSHLMDDSDEPMPVNLLWPLLMWGAEADDPDDRRWILDAIRGLEEAATNAKLTADLLTEVHRRQDEAHQRIDIRSVSQDFFSAHFAIV